MAPKEILTDNVDLQMQEKNQTFLILLKRHDFQKEADQPAEVQTNQIDTCITMQRSVDTFPKQIKLRS